MTETGETAERSEFGADGRRAGPPVRSGRRRRAALRSLVAIVPALAAACGGSAPASAPAAPPSPSTRPETPAAPPTAAPPAPTALPPTPTPEPRSPFTGQLAADPALLHRRIVGVKIDNALPARPQFGLAYADLVYEELAEGGLTRFLALFLEQEPPRIGPVRSARLTDIYLGQEWDFLLAYAGAGTTTSRLLGESLIPLFKAPELSERLDGTPYTRDNRRAAPYNLFVDIAAVRAAAKKEPGIAPEVEIQPFPFRDPPAETGPLRTLTMPYTVAEAIVNWRYDAETSLWRRVMARAPHVDALNGQQIAVENILIQYAQIFTAQNIEPDAAGNPVLDTVLRGENTARLFHSGQIFEGTWSKEHDRAKTAYRQTDGSPLPFRPGKVWVHVVPTDFAASWA